METLGKVCFCILLLMLGLCFTPTLYSKYVNNARANRLVLQFPEVEHLFNQEEIYFEVLETTQTVKHGIGSAKDCVYSASRLYRLADTETILTALTAQLSDLELLPHRPTADGSFNNVQIEPSNDGIRITIEDGPWESALALLDFRCG